MDQSPNLALPYIMAAQAQKHITHNEAVRALDALVQLMVQDRDLAAPPASPAEGARYIVAAAATGEWAGHDGEIAAYQDGAWAYYVPREGWMLWIADEDAAVVWTGAAWSALSAGGGGGVSDHGALSGLGDDDHPQYHNNARGDARYTPINPTTFGVNATPDATNKFALASAASLFNHAGAGHQQKINKNAAANTASQLYQTAFSGRAEIGLLGDDDLHFKVSPDGSTWHEAIIIDHSNGKCSFPLTAAREVLTANRDYYVRSDGNDSNDGLANTAGGAFLTINRAIAVAKTMDPSIYTVTVNVADGTYGPFAMDGPMVGNSQLVIKGNETTPANCLITDNATSDLVSAGLGAALKVTGFKFTHTGSTGIAIKSTGFGTAIEVGVVEFGAVPQYQVMAFTGGYIGFLNDYTISGGAVRHMYSVALGYIFAGGRTITLTGTPDFSSAFCYVTQVGVVRTGNTYTGSATGKRYEGQGNGVIYTGGASASFLPGNAAGSTATGAQYL